MKQRVVFVSLGVASILSTATLSFAALVGASPSFPLIAYQNTAITALQYTPGTQLFSIDARPTAVVFSGSEAPRPILPANSGLRIRVLVDNSGNLVGGVSGADLTISGSVTRVVGTVTNTYSGVLLTGEVTAFGYLETGVDDQFDLRFTPTGGALFSLYSCGTVGVRVASELSTFTGSFVPAFVGRAKGNVGLEDLTPPSITCPFGDGGNATNVECNASSGGEHGAFVSFPAPSATDACDTNITFVYSPPSGSFFPLNDGDMVTNYTATLTATDSSGNESTCSFTVTIKDTEAPLFDDNENPLIEPCAIDRLTFSNDVGQCYATVTLVKPTASDCCSLLVNISVSAVDEHNVVIPLTDLGNGMLQGQFPVSHDGGSNWVTVVADDGRGNTSQSRCPVIVKDTEKPVIDCQNIVIVATNCVTVCSPRHDWHCSMRYGRHDSSCSPGRDGRCHPKYGSFDDDDDRGYGSHGSNSRIRKCRKFGHWWCNKDDDDCEPVGQAVVPTPDVSDNCDDEVEVILNPPAGTQLGIGAHTITATAIDSSGNSNTCTFTVTILGGIKVEFSGCTLYDDNKPDNIETDADIRNRFDVCDRITHCVTLRDICTGQDVTAALRYSVTVVLDVTERTGSYTDSVLYKEIDENPSTAADDGTKMSYSYGQFCYTLNTKYYEKNTVYNTHFFRSDVRVYYNAYPGILVGREDASLESTSYTSCYCY